MIQGMIKGTLILKTLTYVTINDTSMIEKYQYMVVKYSPIKIYNIYRR
jgi:hypothetical protein